MSIEQPWVEKYRPRHLDEIVGQQKIVERLKRFVKDRNMPHLIFAGPAGTGKTTSALALTRDILGNRMKFNETYMELNASDARGIDVIRTLVKDFAKGHVPEGIPFKILILDEADNMTAAAQQALRRTMENYSKTCRMILICNYSNKIILPIQSRCVIFRFSPLQPAEIKERIEDIASREGVALDNDGLDAILYVSGGDLRRAVNYLQACATVTDKITRDVVYKITGRVRPEDIREMIKTALSGELKKAKDKLTNFIAEYGISGRNLISQIRTEIYNIPEIDDERIKMKIIRILSKFDYRLGQGATELVQLNGMLAQISLLGKNIYNE